MRTMTSWVKVPGQNTWETRPLPHASCAVSFRPLSSISFAWKEEERMARETREDTARTLSPSKFRLCASKTREVPSTAEVPTGRQVFKKM